MHESIWQEEEIPIIKIKQLLEDGYEIEVDSPDGYVPVNFFVDKGNFQEHVLTTKSGKQVRCNENHLFETIDGWKFAKDIIGETCKFLIEDGVEEGSVAITDNVIPIVDINVDHPNHRYYTNGVSSHNTGAGKSLFMCHVASSVMLQGKNVLYITMEMAEERISERIDANLMDTPIDQLDRIGKTKFIEKVQNISKKTVGKLIVKEYPTGAAHVGHFRALLKELKLKKHFTPDIIFIDYLNICSSSRMKSMGGAINSYTYVKAIAEEIRGLAVEFNVPVVSATQTTRSGYGNSDPGLEDTSECIFVDEIVTLRNGGTKKIKDVEVGDQIVSNDAYKTVMKVHHPKMKKCVRIKTKSGKTIIVSKGHVFPTKDGRLSVNSGLKVGSKLSTK